MRGVARVNAGDRCATALPQTSPRPRQTTATIKRTGRVSMMDILMIAIALSLFGLAIAYAHAIEKG
jgi:hypothetical protein